MKFCKLLGVASAFIVVVTLTGCETLIDKESKTESVEEVTLDSVLAQGRVGTIEEARALYAAKRFEAAASRLGSLIRAEPGNAEAALLMGESLLRLGRPREAVGYFSAAKKDPNFVARGLQGVGIALLHLGESDVAFERLNEALTYDPNLWRAHNAIGRVFDSRHEWSAAEEKYLTATSIQPSASAPFNNLGVSYLMQRRFDEAIDSFEAALRIDPDLEVAGRNLRIALALNGEYTDALAGVPRQEIGYVAMLRGEYDIAEAYLTRALEVSPSYHHRAASNFDRLSYLQQRAQTAPNQ